VQYTFEPKYINIEALNGLQSPKLIVIYSTTNQTTYSSESRLHSLHGYALHLDLMPLKVQQQCPYPVVVEVAASHPG
jgi:hypothetical protein